MSEEARSLDPFWGNNVNAPEPPPPAGQPADETEVPECGAKQGPPLPGIEFEAPNPCHEPKEDNGAASSQLENAGINDESSPESNKHLPLGQNEPSETIVNQLCELVKILNEQQRLLLEQHKVLLSLVYRPAQARPRPLRAKTAIRKLSAILKRAKQFLAPHRNKTRIR